MGAPTRAKHFSPLKYVKTGLGPIQPPIQRISWVNQPGREVKPSPPASLLRMTGATPTIPLYAFTVWTRTPLSLPSYEYTGLRRGSAADRLLGLRVRIPPEA
jgi:hypothetical protein